MKKYIFHYFLDLILVVDCILWKWIWEWRSDYRRSHYYYEVESKVSQEEGLWRLEILVPIPATNDGEFVILLPRKNPHLKNLLQEYILHTRKVAEEPLFWKHHRGLDNNSINGNWTTFIAETEEGYMLGLRRMILYLKIFFSEKRRSILIFSIQLTKMVRYFILR